jgi:ribose 1,5-bisphosphokinase
VARRRARGVSARIDTRSRKEPRPAKIGPGRLVLVVGPSGAGKDTLINGARLACASDSSVVFPRRVITRPSSAFEDHGTTNQEAFDQAVGAGAFSLCWKAHGNGYGIPVSIEDDIRCGRTVVCNVSRTAVDLARRRYTLVAVVLITAPQRILQARLASRERASDGDLIRRIARSAELDRSCRPDFVIRNIGRRVVGIRRLLKVIRDPRSQRLGPSIKSALSQN